MFNLKSICTGFLQTNTWLWETPHGNFLFDAPQGSASWIRDSGISIQALILTHQHFDHVMDAAEIAKEHACPIVAWSSYSRDLTLENLFSVAPGMGFAVPPYQVNHLLESSPLPSFLSPLQLEVLHVPGHSPDGTCFYHAGEGLLFAGDTLFAGGIGRYDFPGGNGPQLIQGIRTQILSLPPITRVLPGHGPETTVAHELKTNPYLGEPSCGLGNKC